jgi:hypothetical protein
MLSDLAFAHAHQAKFFAALIGTAALIGATVSTYITVQVVRTDMTNYLEDYTLPTVSSQTSVTSRCSRPPC